MHSFQQLDAHDEPNEQEFGRPSGTLTSLVSFDPKSRTLLRVREHRDSDDDDVEGYTHIEKVGRRSRRRNTLSSTTYRQP